MAEIPIKSLKEAENKIRDLINLVSVYNEEEVDGVKQISDDVAEELKEKLLELAKLIGKA